jgi:DNA modification methylase
MAKSWYCFDFLTAPHSQVNPRAVNRKAKTADSTKRKAPARPPAISAMYGLVTAGKGTAAYNAHSYPTKVPPEAIEPFLNHFTKPGDVVLDPFCGSGMTGLAALRTGRRAVLNDLSPLAIHLTHNHTTPCDPESLLDAWHAIRESLNVEERRHYGIRCDACRKIGTIRYTIWSDVYRCPECAAAVNLWDSATELERGAGTKVLRCTTCERHWPKSASTRIRSEPTYATFACNCSSSLRSRVLTQRERASTSTFSAPAKHLFVPNARVGETREMYQRSALHLRGIAKVRDFYTPRNLSALARLWDEIGGVRDRRVRSALAFAFTNTAWHGTRMRRFNARGGQRPLTGTLYIPQLSSEANVFDVFGHKIRQLARFYRELGKSAPLSPSTMRLGSATDLGWLADASIDYVFTDPPFGANIFYADCNLIAESWLGMVTDVDQEAVVNRSRSLLQGGKTLLQYQVLLQGAFAEMHRVLRPGCWATVVFQSSDGAVWGAIEAAAERAGFTVHAADMLDKVQQSMKGYRGRRGREHVASFDIVVHLRKPQPRDPTRQSLRALDVASRKRTVLKALERHLSSLPTREDSARTLPFLYSLGVRALLNAGASVNGFSMERLRTMLVDSDHAEENGRWYAKQASHMPRARGRRRVSALV